MIIHCSRNRRACRTPLASLLLKRAPRQVYSDNNNHPIRKIREDHYLDRIIIVLLNSRINQLKVYSVTKVNSKACLDKVIHQLKALLKRIHSQDQLNSSNKHRLLILSAVLIIVEAIHLLVIMVCSHSNKPNNNIIHLTLNNHLAMAYLVNQQVAKVVYSETVAATSNLNNKLTTQIHSLINNHNSNKHSAATVELNLTHSCNKVRI